MRARTLEAHRARALLSVRALAARAGVAPRTVVLVEGGRQTPHPATISRLAAALGVAVCKVVEFRAVIARAGGVK